MLRTFRAILKGNLLEWQEEVNQGLQGDCPVQVLVTFIQEEPLITTHSRGQQMAAVVEQLAQTQVFSGIDPLVWQRQSRQDRERPGEVNDAT
ncbi:MAG: hypothetical protein RID53_03800 [Coleofasciculus sp. B1-GNL1-01]|uniref:hypothetical protein n=1 Tax=Coleofasciculus sp. B1-GNL1-01 TaxID=3068484 RepID=UPI0033044961